MDMSFLQVNEKLQETFPMELSEDRSGFIRSIIDALQSGAAAEVIHQSEQVELPNGSTLKQEIPDMDSQTHSSSAATTFENDGEGDGDIEIVGEVINGEVTFIGRKLKEQPEVLLLEDDDLEESDVSFGVPSPATGPSSSASRKRKRKRKVTWSYSRIFRKFTHSNSDFILPVFLLTTYLHIFALDFRSCIHTAFCSKCAKESVKEET